ncbi:MAG: radical SAM protein [Desulfotomaculales bacterium]
MGGGERKIYVPLVVTLEVTNQCNLRCRHCYAGAGERLPGELTLAEITGLLDELSRLGTVEVEFSGGEPLLRPELPDLLGYARSLDFSVVLVTNGTLIGRETARQLAGIGLKHVQVSLDGLKESHEYLRGRGTYERTLRAIEALVLEGVTVAVRTTVTRRNVGELEALADLAVRLGAGKLGLVRFFPAGRGMAYKDELMLRAADIISFHETVRRLRERYGDATEISADPCGLWEEGVFTRHLQEGSILCPCGRTWALVRPDGVVSPCEILVFYAGSVRTQSFAEIWKEAPVMKTFRAFDPDLLKGACGTCGYRKVCAGYCRALAVLHSGDFYAEDFTCYRALTGKGGSVHRSRDEECRDGLRGLPADGRHFAGSAGGPGPG